MRVAAEVTYFHVREDGTAHMQGKEVKSAIEKSDASITKVMLASLFCDFRARVLIKYFILINEIHINSMIRVTASLEFLMRPISRVIIM